MRLPSQLITIHRWLGIVLCLFMAAWFVSGAVLIYVPFPALSASERLDRASEVDTSVIKLSPADAIRASGLDLPIDRMRLVARDGRPLYVVKARGQPVVAVWADNGSPARLQLGEEARAIAARFSGETIGQVEGPIDYDQWIVSQGFDSTRPYMRVSVDDAAGTVLYVSQSTGEVQQRTTRAQRGWNYVGAVVHWIYPTVLRRHPVAWNQVVWWLSLVGIVVVLLGAVLGIDQMIRAVRTRRASISMHRGWMKWHHVLGLCAFLFVLTWIFSGWLSMDNGLIFSRPDPDSRQVDRFRGITLAAAGQLLSVQSIRGLGGFRELEIKGIADTPLVFVRSQNRQAIYEVNSGQPFPGDVLPESLVLKAVQAAWPGITVQSVEQVTADDVYRKVRQNELPMSTFRVRLNDPENTWVHVDATSGEIISVMDRSRRVHRWLYHGFHSLDFPGLIDRRPLWDVVILALLTIGFAFSVTGVFIGFRRLKRSLGKSPLGS